MSTKHFLFFSYDCPNSKKLLGQLKGTEYQSSFIYIDVQATRRLPHTLKGVPAILLSMQPETSILHGKHAFVWVQSLMSNRHRSGQNIRGHRSSHGPQNPRSHMSEPGHAIVDGGGSNAEVADKDYLGNAPFEMGGRGYSDKYSFIDNDAGMSHRYEYVNGHEGPGEIGKAVTHEPGEALKDAKGVSQKMKQLNVDLKRMQEERDTIGRGIQRI